MTILCALISEIFFALIVPRPVQVILARLNGRGSGTGNSSSKGSNVSSFRSGDGLQVGDIGRGETESSEVRVGELGETLLVESSLEVF